MPVSAAEYLSNVFLLYVLEFLFTVEHIFLILMVLKLFSQHWSDRFFKNNLPLSINGYVGEHVFHFPHIAGPIVLYYSLQRFLFNFSYTLV